MWPFTDWDWATTMILWLLAMWGAVLVTTWIIFRNIGGPHHRTH
jgi:hypothetical protein